MQYHSDALRFNLDFWILDAPRFNTERTLRRYPNLHMEICINTLETRSSFDL